MCSLVCTFVHVPAGVGAYVSTLHYDIYECISKQNDFITDGGGGIETVGKNSITCITFDKPLLKWNGDFKASQGIWTKNFGVEIQKNCGLNGDCGRFRVPSKIEMPYFKNNDFFDLSVSVWFKRRGAGCWPVLVSNGDCLTSTIQVPCSLRC